METNSPGRSEGSSKAPWWVYVGAVVAANFARQQVVDPDDVSTGVNIALLAGVSAAVIVVVWLGHRLLTSR